MELSIHLSVRSQKPVTSDFDLFTHISFSNLNKKQQYKMFRILLLCVNERNVFVCLFVCLILTPFSTQFKSYHGGKSIYQRHWVHPFQHSLGNIMAVSPSTSGTGFTILSLKLMTAFSHESYVRDNQTKLLCLVSIIIDKVRFS